jgi:hypothetical protein
LGDRIVGEGARRGWLAVVDDLDVAYDQLGNPVTAAKLENRL